MTDKHRMTDEQLGNELESLIRGNVESVTPPAGTFLSIQDRLGSQDVDWSPSRLIRRIVPSNWGLPMFTGMFVKVAAAIVIAVAIGAVLVFQGRDTDQNDVAPAADPTATAEVQVEATATNVPMPASTPQPTAEPTATSTILPTPQPEPTATANPLLDVDVQAAIDVLETEFEAIRNSDVDLFLTTCFGQTVVRAGGYSAVKAALELDWPNRGRNISAENITLVNELPGEPSFVILRYDLHEDGEFVSSEITRIMGSEGNWMSTNLDDCGATAPEAVSDPIQNPPDITALPTRTLSAELDPDQAIEQPSEERVIELWTEYLSDSLLPINQFYPNLGDLHMCGDGTVMTTSGLNPSNILLDTPETWYVARNAAMSSSTWWEVVLTIALGPESGARDPKLPLITLKIEDGKVVATNQQTLDVPVYESEWCTTRDS